MKGASIGIIEIQRDFLNFEVDYKITQNIFTEVYNITRSVKRAKMDNINEKSYKLSEMFIEMSERYILTKTKLEGLEKDCSLLDDYVKQVLVNMIEEDRTMLTNIEQNLEVILKMLVTTRVVSKKKLNKIKEVEEKSKVSVIFVSKYYTIYPSKEPEILLRKIISRYLSRLLIIIPLILLMTTENIIKVTNFISSFLLSKEGIPLTLEQGSDILSSPDLFGLFGSFGSLDASFGSLDYFITLTKPIITLLALAINLIGSIILIYLVCQLMIDLLYATLPSVRQFLSRKISYNIDLENSKICEPLQIEKFKLDRAKEILSSFRSMPEYTNSKSIVFLSAKLNKKTTEDVLTMDESYAILLSEVLYEVTNNYYVSNKNLVDYSMGLTSKQLVSLKPLILRVAILKQKLGIED